MCKDTGRSAQGGVPLAVGGSEAPGGTRLSVVAAAADEAGEHVLDDNVGIFAAGGGGGLAKRVTCTCSSVRPPLRGPGWRGEGAGGLGRLVAGMPQALRGGDTRDSGAAQI